MRAIDVTYNNHFVGAALYDPDTKLTSFEYSPSFIETGIQLSPLKMPLSDRIYTFKNLDHDAFRGMPGLLAESLPDDFGNAVLNAWLATQNREEGTITPVERLQYTGKRGMGALEYTPASPIHDKPMNKDVQLDELVSIAQSVLDHRDSFSVSLDSNSDSYNEDAMLSLLSVGTSAGGARPKAVLAFNKDFSIARSGQLSAPKGFTHYLMKFDGVTQHKEGKETFGDPLGYGAMEYVYYKMATLSGVKMMPCRLLNEGSRRHFLTERFDRIGNQKVHFQSLFGLQHVSHKHTGHYSYAELFMTARSLKLPREDALQLLKRCIFNIVARNHDDHSKNFGFILNDNHQWRLAPAYDLAYSYKPGSPWVEKHWMTLNGKRDNFTRNDLYSLESISPVFTRALIDEYIDKTKEAVSQWENLAQEEAVPTPLINTISKNLRMYI